MQLSLEEFSNIEDKIVSPKVESAMLKLKLEQARKDLQKAKKECKRLQQKISCMEEKVPSGMGDEYVLISITKLRKFLGGIKNVGLVSFVVYVLQKILPQNTDASVLKRITDAAPDQILTDIHITADGDVNVQGNLNMVHDNQNVIL